MYYYKQIKLGKIVSVESKNRDSVSPHFIKATKTEYDGYLASLPPPLAPESKRDLAAEVDELKARLNKAGVD